ncbi:scabin-related ADP-ribosyltransferase [Paraburkholderia caffeinilytica]|uniref:scabin-related ADP-ribosyltransferase n=1 Tax=Paraburkholderia caffeinilytica TaxID=1761016 RepID=UPI003DA0D59B
MFSGSRNLQSSLINTGYDAKYDFARGFGVFSGNDAYLIDAPGGISQSASGGCTPEGKLSKQVIAGPDAVRNVVVFPGGIRREYIKGAFKINTKNHKL